jgi:hypothetical protein
MDEETKEYKKLIRYFMCEMTQQEFEELTKDMEKKPYKFNVIKEEMIQQMKDMEDIIIRQYIQMNSTYICPKCALCGQEANT